MQDAEENLMPKCAHCDTPLRPSYPVDYYDATAERWVLLHNLCKPCDRKERSFYMEE